MIRLRPSVLALSLVMFLSACESAEEKAEGYFQSGLALLAQGDEDRAMIEFRNVFKYDGFHKEARETYAGVLRKRGDLSGAYGQYLRLIEQYPDTVEVRLTLAEMAMANSNWDEVERHGRAAQALSPDLPRAKAIGIALDYRAAVQIRDEAKRTELADTARAMLTDQSDSLVLRRIVIDRGLSAADPQVAMPDVEAALVIEPDSLEFNGARLRLLALAEDIPGTGAQLKAMVELFPENTELKTALIQWFMGQKDIDGAEAFLRAQAGALDGPTEGHLTVVQLLNTARSREAGRAELVKLVAANTGNANADLYGAFLATMDFEDGKTDQAVTALETLLATAEASDQTRKIQSMLARMQDASGKREAAQAVVENILAADASNVEALKLRAGWRIAEDRPGEAILDLRSAQNQAPRDPQIMTLMAAAHQRDGNLDLAGEQLAKAVEASGAGVAESLRYAQFLRQQGRLEVATRVMVDARRANPGSPAVLGQLADLYLASSRWVEAEEIAQTLRSANTPEANETAQRLQAAILLGQNRIDEGLTILENGVAANNGDARSVAVLVQTQVRAGKVEEARRFLAEARAKSPDNPGLALLDANLESLLGNAKEAEAGYRSLIASQPKMIEPVQLLYAMLTSQERMDEAGVMLDEAITIQPDSPVLLWMSAGAKERAGKIDEAIAIYEKLYAANSSDVIAANNLASLITTYRDDPAGLERAAVIARRLRDAREPAFQDTYGWIEYRRGNLEEAVKYLEPAAAGLPADPLAQFHLGMVYADLNRKDEAITQFERMLKLTEGKTMPQIAVAQERLKTLRATP